MIFEQHYCGVLSAQTHLSCYLHNIDLSIKSSYDCSTGNQIKRFHVNTHLHTQKSVRIMNHYRTW